MCQNERFQPVEICQNLKFQWVEIYQAADISTNIEMSIDCEAGQTFSRVIGAVIIKPLLGDYATD